MKLIIPLTALLIIFSINTQNIYSQDYKQEMLDLVNELRAQNGVDPLYLNEDLNDAAHYHSLDMGENNYFSHTGQNGSSFIDRIRDTGYEGSPRGENIAAGNSTAQATFNQWVNSSGHLQNMLSSNSNEMGIGYANVIGSNFRHYWTQVFGSGRLSTDENNIYTNNSIKVYPNPVVDVLHIKSNSNLDHIRLINMSGQVVYEKHSKSFLNSITINIKHLPNGIYFLGNKNNLLRKIVKN